MLTALYITRDLHNGAKTAAELKLTHNISLATLKREIANARHMGADIISIREGKKSVYVLVNWDEVKNTVTRWIELEETRNLKTPLSA